MFLVVDGDGKYFSDDNLSSIASYFPQSYIQLNNQSEQFNIDAMTLTMLRKNALM